MKLKKEVIEKLEICFKNLIDSGFYVSAPRIEVRNFPIREIGNPVPIKFETEITAEFTIALKENMLELVQ